MPLKRIVRERESQPPGEQVEAEVRAELPLFEPDEAGAMEPGSFGRQRYTSACLGARLDKASIHPAGGESQLCRSPDRTGG